MPTSHTVDEIIEDFKEREYPISVRNARLLVAEIERLREDKELMDWLGESGYIGPPRPVVANDLWFREKLSSWRDAVRAARAQEQEQVNDGS